MYKFFLLAAVVAFHPTVRYSFFVGSSVQPNGFASVAQPVSYATVSSGPIVLVITIIIGVTVGGPA